MPCQLNLFDNVAQLRFFYNSPSKSLPVLWSIFSTHHGDTFPNLVILATMAMVFPVHTADVERGFSAQNMLRNRLSSQRLNIIATIKLEDPHWREFNYVESLAAFRKVKERRLYQGLMVVLMIGVQMQFM